MVDSSIRDFYRNQTVFLTGGTGFLGKLLVEKLLRACPDLKRIFLLVRTKRGKSQSERFQEIFDSVCFSGLKKQFPDFEKKIRLVAGDCCEPFLGLSEEDQSKLEEEVTCVIHVAANVRFDQGIRPMVHANVRSVRDLISMAKKMPLLKAFVYVSTVFSHCTRRDIEEKFYEVDIEPEKVIAMAEIMSEDMLEIVTPQLLGKYPNTYVYTKALAEEVIRTKGDQLPISIVRPAIVVSTYHEPLEGWIDNFSGIVGLVTGISLGAIRVLNIKSDNKAALVAADYVINNILAAAWDVGRPIETNGTREVPIYNFTGSNDNLITWKRFIDILENCYWKFPSNRSLLYCKFFRVTNETLYKILVFFMHTLFSYFIDFVLYCIKRPPIVADKYKKINKLLACLTFFTLNEWNFTNTNVERLWNKMGEEDQKIFYFNMRRLDWDQFLIRGVKGGRIYLLNDPMETVPEAKRKVFILGILHYCCVGLLWFLLYKIISFLHRAIF